MQWWPLAVWQRRDWMRGQMSGEAAERIDRPRRRRVREATTQLENNTTRECNTQSDRQGDAHLRKTANEQQT